MGDARLVGKGSITLHCLRAELGREAMVFHITALKTQSLAFQVC